MFSTTFLVTLDDGLLLRVEHPLVVRVELALKARRTEVSTLAVSLVARNRVHCMVRHGALSPVLFPQSQLAPLHYRVH